MAQVEVLEGVIDKVEDGKYGKYLKLQGRPPSEFINSSKYQDSEWPETLRKGQTVRLRLEMFNGKFYLKGEDIEIIGDGPPMAPLPTENGASGRVDPYSSTPTPGTFAWKDRMIIRQTSLERAWGLVKAVGFRGVVDVDEPQAIEQDIVARVLRVAGELEEWVTRPVLEAEPMEPQEEEAGG